MRPAIEVINNRLDEYERGKWYGQYTVVIDCQAGQPIRIRELPEQITILEQPGSFNTKK